ncbi:Acyl-CoA ligase sidI [Paramyrothecium foliicola]|nr:Acyl-CoA ligase sidI [Paramyrothecium foliicola]
MSTAYEYPVESSQLNLRDPSLEENKVAWQPILERFNNALQAVSAEGSEESLLRHQERGQLLPRDRIALLLDQDSPFLELGPFAGFGNENSTPCANLIAGIGNSGGAWNEMTVLKVNRMLEIAFENDLPLISLVQSAGVFLPQQFRVFHKGGQLFHDLAVRSLHGKPSCAIVFGSSTAGGAYHPALSDYTIFVQNQAQVFLGGPPLVKMATGEVVQAEELGGAQVHATQTGLADQLATDEFDAINQARMWAASLKPRAPSTNSVSAPLAPRYSIENLLSLVNPDIRKFFDMREVLLRIVDDSRLSIFKPEYGKNLLTAWAHIMGRQVGIVANQISVINPQEAHKGAQFIRMCNQEGHPIIFLHNVTGFMVGTKAEHAGIIKAGAQLVSAVSTSKVPHISIILGASYGAGNYAMCGRSYKPRFLFAWPISKCSVMGPDQLAGVMEQIEVAKAKRLRKTIDKRQMQTRTEAFRSQVQKDAESYSTSGMLIDDGIIDPRDTRDVLGILVAVMSAIAAGARPPLFIAPQLSDPKTGKPIIQKVFIANRGEIACRIIATCKKLQIETVAVYVEEDKSSRHVLEADEAINLGSIDALEKNPFLNTNLLIETALNVGAQAIHPGYGYLSENAEFATQCAQKGLIFIGPSPEAMSILGDKRSAKKYLSEMAPDVPLIPGFASSSTDAKDLEKAAEGIGYPIMLKASAGGGGKGMRVVYEPSQLREELARVQSEASRSFGSADCILEKYIESSKHVEIQIIGDTHGNCVSFFERDCSIQRRHQKVLEESPCPFLTDQVREKMGQTAIRIAKLIGYANAGTVEFVVDVKTSSYFFLEVNARLQVEHPITEEITGVDLVALQLFVASGGSLSSISQIKSLKQVGHAIECRLCAEDPQRDFFPEHGKIHLWRPADGVLGPGRDVRYETAVQTGSSVSIYFDSMIAKIVVWAPSRLQAIHKMTKVLAQMACIGVKTNQLFLQKCLSHPELQNPAYNTSFIPKNLNALLRSEIPQELQMASNLLPSLFLRTLARREQDAGSSPFKHVRNQFRNQRCDPVSKHHDIVVSKGIADPLLCVWLPPTTGQTKGQYVKVVNLENAGSTKANNDKTRQSAAELVTKQYNFISNILRNLPSDPSSALSVDILSWRAEQGQSPTADSLAVTIEFTIGSDKFLAYCVTPSYRPGNLNGAQEVYCHFPTIGTWHQSARSSMLAYIESCRTSVAASDATGSIAAPMPCKVLSVEKSNGEEVKKNDVVMVVESMKMEVSIKAPTSGVFQTTWGRPKPPGPRDFTSALYKHRNTARTLRYNTLRRYRSSFFAFTSLPPFTSSYLVAVQPPRPSQVSAAMKSDNTLPLLPQAEERAAVVVGDCTAKLCEQTLGQVIDEQARRFHDREALLVPWQSQRLTFGDLRERGIRVSKALLAAGLRHGECVAVMAGNCHEYIEAFLGGARLGCPVAVINNTFSPDDLQWALDRIDCRLLFISAKIGTRSMQPHLEKVDKTRSRRIVVFGQEESTPSSEQVRSYRQFLREFSHLTSMQALQQAELRVKNSDILNLQFTSGTTGRPKAASLTHRNLINNGKLNGEAMRLTPDDIVCSPPPLYHCFGLVMGFLGSFTHGSSIIFPSETFNAVQTLASLVQEKATALLGVPTMFTAELEVLAETNYNIITVRTGLAAGSPVAPSLMAALKAKMNIYGMLIAYGMTETSPVTFITSLDDPEVKLFNTIGRVLPHTAAKVVDNHGKTVPIGVRGELCTAGFALQKGYWRDPIKTKEVMKADEDGVVWMHTGDEGYLDGDGYGHVTGRIKDLIIRGKLPKIQRGENLAPGEIEDCLAGHPQIVECCAVGLTDRKYGEVVSVFLKLRGTNRNRPSEDEVRRWVTARLGRVKSPTHIFWVGDDGVGAEIPKTGSGKYQKHLTRALGNKLVAATKTPAAKL